MYCVIVGDIVNSREMSHEVREKVTRAAQEAFDRINAGYADSLVTTFGMVRGDAFEGVMLTTRHAARIVQDIIKAFYREEKTAVRVSVVFGELTVIGDDRNITDGPAFHKAFDDLERMKGRRSTHWLQASFDVGDRVRPLVDSNMALLSALTGGWTERQRETVWAMEEHNCQQKAVSEEMGIPPSVVSKQLKAASFDAYRKAWDGLAEYLAVTMPPGSVKR